MKRIPSLLLMMAVCLSCPASGADLPHYTGQVLPSPREVLTDCQLLPLGEAGLTIRLGEDMGGAGKLAEELLLQRLADTAEAAGGPAKKAVSIVVYLGTFDDDLFRHAREDRELGFESLVIPKRGYAIRVRESADGNKDIFAAGQDVRGAFCAAVTLLQQMGVEDGEPVLKCADINDWPHWQRPYVMEYGPASREQLIELAMYKVGHYAIQHRREWREFKPDHMYGKRRAEDSLSEMAAFREETGLFDYMLLLHIYASPSEDQERLDITNEEHVAELAARCRYAATKAFTHIMILADDWTPRESGRYVCMHESERERFGGSVGRAHGYLMARLHDTLKREYPALELSICAAPYSLRHVYGGSTGHKPHMVRYLRDLDAEMPPDIAVVWTGPVVGSPSIEREHFLEYSRLVGNRPTFLWDNSNCCSVPSMHQFETSRYEGFAADSHGIFYLNAFALYWPWQRTFMLNAIDALWNPEAFDAERSYEQVLEKIYGPGMYAVAGAYRRTRAAMQGLEGDRDRLAPLVAKADEQLKAMEAAGLPTRRLRKDWKQQKAFVDVQVAEATVARFAQRPVIDGKLDEACWARTEVLAGFSPYGPTQQLDPTEVRLGYDPENFYVAFTCHHQGDLPIAQIDGRRDASVFSFSDAAGMMLQPQGDAYGHFVVDHAGNIFDERTKGHSEWDPAWTVAIHKEDKVWTAEITVPLEELESFPMDEWPKSGTEWRANFHRYYAAKGQTSAWSNTHGNRFHVTQFFGRLTFE